MFKFLSNVVEGTVGTALNVAKLPVSLAVEVATLGDNDDVLEDNLEDLSDSFKKIGKLD